MTIEAKMKMRLGEENGSPERIRRRILILDDEPGFLTVAKINLEKTGDYEVETVVEPMEVFGVARSFRPDILLIDMMMPGMDGGDVLARWQTIPDLRSIPFIIITALVSHGESYHETPDGMVLPKPVGLDRLIESIEEVLAGSVKKNRNLQPAAI